MNISKIPAFGDLLVQSNKYNINYDETYKQPTHQHLIDYTNKNMTKGVIYLNLIPTSFRVEARYKKNANNLRTQRLDTFEIQSSLDTQSKNEDFINELNRKLKKVMPENIFPHIALNDYYFEGFKAKVKKEKDSENITRIYIEKNELKDNMPAFEIHATKKEKGSFDIKMKVARIKQKSGFKTNFSITKDGFLHHPNKNKLNPKQEEAAKLFETYIESLSTPLINTVV